MSSDLTCGLWRPELTLMLHFAVFTIFALFAVAGAVNLLVQRHPINAALSLIAVMSSLAVEYLLLGAEFVAAIQVIVYAGAIMVLFVFVIMLLNAGVEERTEGSRVAILLGVPGVLIGAVLVAWTLIRYSGTGEASVGALPGSPQSIGWLLFHDFLLPFEVTSILILIAIMGAVVLAGRPSPTSQQPRKEG
jgi:NADH-quinone oxidoreductase subunit J